MGRYKRKTAHGTWNAQQLQAAIDAVNDGKSIRASASMYKIPESSLRRRMKANKLSTPVLGMSTTFTTEQEKLFANYLLNLSNTFCGLTAIQCRRIAYEIAEKMKLNHKFNRNERLAGKEWLQGFLKRNPQFNVQKSETANTNQIKEFYNKEISLFFDSLQFLIAQYKFSPNRIYNVHETELFTKQETEHFLCSNGKNEIGSDVPWDQGNKITVTCAMNANGIFMPPMFIFPLAQNIDLLKIDTFKGSIIKCNINGCTDEEMHLTWLMHFVLLIKPTKNNPVLLIQNSHNSHTSLNVYEFCKNNNIQILCLPPHMAYKMQPLNATVFGPLKRAYYRECEMHMKNNNLKQVNIYEVAGLFAKAFNKIVTKEKGMKGFQITGIWPIDPFILHSELRKVNCENDGSETEICKEKNISVINAVKTDVETIQHSIIEDAYPYIFISNKSFQNNATFIKNEIDVDD